MEDRPARSRAINRRKLDRCKGKGRKFQTWKQKTVLVVRLSQEDCRDEALRQGNQQDGERYRHCRAVLPTPDLSDDGLHGHLQSIRPESQSDLPLHREARRCEKVFHRFEESNERGGIVLSSVPVVLARGSAVGLPSPFRAPAVSPETRERWRKKKITSSGEKSTGILAEGKRGAPHNVPPPGPFCAMRGSVPSRRSGEGLDGCREDGAIPEKAEAGG